MCQNQKNLLSSISSQLEHIINLIHLCKYSLINDTYAHLILRTDPTNHIDEMLSIFQKIQSTFSQTFILQQDDSQDQPLQEFKAKPWYEILGVNQNHQNNQIIESYQAKRSLMHLSYSQLQLTKQKSNYGRGPYRSYSLQEKQQIIQLHQMGYKFATIHRMLNIPQKNIVRWCRNGVERKKGAGRKVGDESMERSIIEWIEANFKQGESIKVKQIRDVAKWFSTKSGFKSSKGWLKNFIKRHKINQKFFII